MFWWRRGRGEISVRVTDDSIGVEMEGDVAGGSDGAETRRNEFPSKMTGEMELDSTEVGGEIRLPNPPLREGSAEAGLLEIGRGISLGPASLEIIGTSDGGEMTLSTSSNGSGLILTGSGSSALTGDSTRIGVSTLMDLSVSTSDSVSTTVLAFCPQRHSAVPKSIDASLRQTLQVSKSVLTSVVHTLQS